MGAKSGVGILIMGISKPEIIIKSVIPVIMAGILGIYGLIVAVILKQNIKQEIYTIFDGWIHLSSGLWYGLSSLGAGIAIGIAVNADVRALGQQERLLVGYDVDINFFWSTWIIWINCFTYFIERIKIFR